MTEQPERPPTPELARYLKTVKWTFAKTYADTWPHEYVVEGRTDRAMFNELSELIVVNGYLEHFFTRLELYWDYDGYTYWQIEDIINRCVVADTYHRRKVDGRMPEYLKNRK